MLQLITNRQYWLKGELHTLVDRRGDTLLFREGEPPRLGAESKDFTQATADALAQQNRLLLIPEGRVVTKELPLEVFRGHPVIFKHKGIKLLHKDGNQPTFGFTFPGSIRPFIAVRFGALNKTIVKRYSRDFCAKLGLPPQRLDGFFDKGKTIEFRVEPETEKVAITPATTPDMDATEKKEVVHV